MAWCQIGTKPLSEAMVQSGKNIHTLRAKYKLALINHV